jgi:hypothetical protein
MGKQTSDNCFGTEGFECFLIMSGYSDVVHMSNLWLCMEGGEKTQS